MMPPSPVILLAIFMIGYPLVQIAAIRFRRRWRLEFNALVTDLQANYHLKPSQRHRVKFLSEASRGGTSTFGRFVKMPLKLFVSALTDPAADDEKSNRYRNEDEIGTKITQLHHLAIQLEWATWPITFMTVVPVALLAGGLGSVVAWAKGAAKPVFPSLADIERVAMFGAMDEGDMSYN